MRRKITYRPSKAQGAFGIAAGIVFVVIGLVFVIPTFGAFGIVWTLLAATGTGMEAYRAFGKGYAGPEIRIEDEGGRTEVPPAIDLNAESRLEQLKSLRDAGLINDQEYQEKRREILDQL